MSVEISGLESLQSALSNFDTALQDELNTAVEAGMRQCQRDAVQFAPIRTGKLRSLLGSSEALKVIRKGGQIRAEFGFRTGSLQKEGFRYYFVEFGTKAYKKGDTRNAGYDKRGRLRQQRVKHGTPARPAQPFMRPAFKRLRERLYIARNEAVVRAAERAVLGR